MWWSVWNIVICRKYGDMWEIWWPAGNLVICWKYGDLWEIQWSVGNVAIFRKYGDLWEIWWSVGNDTPSYNHSVKLVHNSNWFRYLFKQRLPKLRLLKLEVESERVILFQIEYMYKHNSWKIFKNFPLTLM